MKKNRPHPMAVFLSVLLIKQTRGTTALIYAGVMSGGGAHFTALKENGTVLAAEGAAMHRKIGTEVPDQNNPDTADKAQ